MVTPCRIGGYGNERFSGGRTPVASTLVSGRPLRPCSDTYPVTDTAGLASSRWTTVSAVRLSRRALGGLGAGKGAHAAATVGWRRHTRAAATDRVRNIRPGGPSRRYCVCRTRRGGRTAARFEKQRKTNTVVGDASPRLPPAATAVRTALTALTASRNPTSRAGRLVTPTLRDNGAYTRRCYTLDVRDICWTSVVFFHAPEETPALRLLRPD